jgi:predicted ATPase
VLDGADAIGTIAGPALLRVLDMAPETRFIATARMALGLEVERVLELSPLGHADAVHLLVERARAVRPSFELAESDPGDIAELVRRVDGLPLGIELVAARVGVLGVRQLLERIGGAADERDRAPAPLGPLHDALVASWSLLDESERIALARVSVFRGGFSAEAGEAVIGTDLDSSASRVLDVLESLRKKSMVMTEPALTRLGEVRFFVLESVREIALEAYADRAAEARPAHARYYCSFAERWSAEVDGKAAVEAVQRLAAERENIRAAADFELAATGEGAEAVERAIGALVSLERLAITRDPIEWYVERLTRAIERASEAGAQPRTIFTALSTRATLRLFVGDDAAAVEDYRSGQAIAERIGEPELAARMLAAAAVARCGMIPESDAGSR